jgi:hypothetical protein
VGLVEAVAAEGLDLARDLLDDRAVVSVPHRLLDELAQLGANQLGVLLTDGFAQDVRLGERNASQRLRNAHHLLLVGDDAVGGLENRLELGENVGDRLLTALPAHVHLVHPRVERARAHQRIRRHEIVEAIGADALQHVGRERGLELEHADGSASAEHQIGVGIVERKRVEVRRRAGALADSAQRVADDGEGREAEEIHLEHASVLERGHVVLCYDDGILVAVGRSRAFRCLGADRDVVVEGSRRDDDPGGVHTSVAREAFQPYRVVEEAAVALLPLLHFAAVVLARRVELPNLGNPLDRFLDGERKVGMVRHELGEIVGLGRTEAQGAAHVLDGGAGFQRPEGDDLADRIASIFLAHVLDDFAAPLEAEVDVDVGHRHPLRIEEALEEQIELERADVSNAERVGDERAGSGSAARADGNSLVARGPDEVGNDEEVAGVSGLGDDAKLVVEPLPDVGGERGSVTLDRSFFGQAD